MRSQEDIAGEGLKGAEALLEVCRHVRIFGVVDEVVAGIYVRAADDDDVVTLAAFLRDHGPGGAALGVTGGFVSYECCLAQSDRFVVVEGVVDFGCGVEHFWSGAVLKICFAAGLDIADIGVHDHVFGTAFAFDLRAAGAVVVVGVADEKNLDLFQGKSKLLDAGPDLDW